MPGLPEVETLRRGLSAALPGRRIVSVHVLDHKVASGSPEITGPDVTGHHIDRAGRRGKVLILWLERLRQPAGPPEDDRAAHRHRGGRDRGRRRPPHPQHAGADAEPDHPRRLPARPGHLPVLQRRTAVRLDPPGQHPAVRNRPPASATSTPTSPCITPASTPPARPVPSPWPRPAACTRRSRPSSAAPSRPAAPASPPTSTTSAAGQVTSTTRRYSGARASPAACAAP